MVETRSRAGSVLRYAVFELSAFGSMRLAGEFESSSDAQALREARKLVPYGTGELRHGHRIVCRFGRA